MARQKSYTIDEVAKHDRDDDLYFIYKNKVYDVTPFLAEHPGGEEVIRDFAGKDATDGFDEVGHSKDAHDQLEELLVGCLDVKSAASATAARSAGKRPETQALKPALLYTLCIATVATVMAGYWMTQVRRERMD